MERTEDLSRNYESKKTRKRKMFDMGIGKYLINRLNHPVNRGDPGFAIQARELFEFHNN
jgi:hypothetical protein